MVRENGEELLLVWHASDVRWDGEDQEITYNVLGASESLKIREGDIITVGGSSLVGDEPVERVLPWLAPPHAGCTGEQWGVSGVRLN